MTAPPDDTTTDASTIVAALRTERDAALAREAALAGELAARTAELAERHTEYSERIEHQSATTDVLKAMSASPGDPQPVFDLIVRLATERCNGISTALREYDGQLIHHRAYYGPIPKDSESSTNFLTMFPMVPSRHTFSGRAIFDKRIVYVTDIDAETEVDPRVKAVTPPSTVAVPLMRDDVVIGVIAMSGERGGFSDNQIELLKTFAEQAVIAITSAETYRALQERTAALAARNSEYSEQIEQQLATIDVLKAMSAALSDTQPVFDLITARARELCGSLASMLYEFDGERLHLRSWGGWDPAAAQDYLRQFPMRPDRGTAVGRTTLERRAVHIRDIDQDPEIAQTVRTMGVRSTLAMPLLRDGQVIGAIAIGAATTGGFSDSQVALLQTFAEQAVIAITSAETYRALQARTADLQESLEYQTATSEVLKVISRSTFDLQAVLDTLVTTAARLCGAAGGYIATRDEESFRPVATIAASPEMHAYLRALSIKPGRGTIAGEALLERRAVHVADIAADPAYASAPAVVTPLGGRPRSVLSVPLFREGKLIGVITLGRPRVEPFTDQQIDLVSTFADQAVIAMENARLLGEIRQRQEELRITFENMGDGVAMFDETPRLVAWNSKFQEIMDLPDGVLAERPTFPDYIRYLAERGEYGAGTNPEEEIRNRVAEASRYRLNERVRPDGRVIEIRQVPVAVGGFVIVLADITERKRNEDQIRAARDAAEEASRTIEAAYRDLKAAQANLIQAEKMASLGQLTAGIAHEIKNPLNFVNNFAALSVDLLSELKETAAPGFAALTENQRAEIDDVSAMLTSNLEKITEHGKRADGIVKAMLEHSRGSSGERRMVDLNALIDEALNLAYHGARAQDQSFNVTLERNFGAGIAPIEINPQDITRVFLNIFSNGFYAANKRARQGGDAGFVSTLKVTTIDVGEAVEIRVQDNGTGIPVDIRDKLFQPFFTTKPTGEGTGLGLSITYDIVTKAHGGSITVDSKVGDYSEFTIRLPRNP